MPILFMVIYYLFLRLMAMYIMSVKTLASVIVGMIFNIFITI